MLKNKIEYLKEFALEDRVGLFRKVLSLRTRYITIVLEDIYQSQNASAVLRSSDCFGIQDIHVIENSNEYKVNPDVALGSSKWLSLNKYNSQENNTVSTIQKLKNDGYRIVATTPHTNDVTLDDFDISKGKVALLFGTELRGLSDLAIENADEYLKIPMYGFTESFNISVSAALIMRELTNKLRKSSLSWELTEQEKDELLFEWLLKSIKSSGKIMEKFPG
ncbi:MAG: TrmH family RNA methyltransferase [Marinilabiliales bacterium]|nr:MAG: TrmH family RNA methyltransferase [Marinilabiliales bacterium]